MPRPPSGRQWAIATGGHAAVVVEVGGGLRSYAAHGRPMIDGYAESEMCSGGAGQVLAPWPNRIRDGRWPWQGADQRLPLSEPSAHNAIHGLVRWRPWTLVSHSADAVTVRCQIDPRPGYPCSVLLATTWSVSAGGLRAEHAAENTGETVAPFGLGVHPYLVVPGVPVDDLVLELPAGTALRTDDRGLPVEDYAVAGSALDYRTGRRIGAEVIDTAFTDFRGGVSTVRLTGPTGAGAEVTLEESFSWVQVFTGDTLRAPRRRRSVAVEPMTCPPDAFNSGRDLVVLEPGGSWQGAWTLRPIESDADRIGPGP